MRSKKWLLGLGVLTVMVGWPVQPAAAQVQIYIVPVRATGANTIVGNEIILDTPGQQVALDIFLSDWDPNETGELLKAYQVIVDEASYSTGIAGTLTPFRANCTTSAQCASSIGGGGTCSEPGIPANKCPAGYIGTGRADYVFRSVNNLGGVDQSTLTYRYGAAVVGDAIQNLNCVGGLEPGKVCLADGDCPGFPSFIPDGTCEINHADRYAGTLVLDVPGDARGTFTIILKDAPDSALLDELNEEYTPQTVDVGLITIKCQSNTDCDDNDDCTNDNCNGGGVCSNIPTYNPATECCDPTSGTVTLINDGNPCTQDACDADTGTVDHTPEPAGTTCGNNADTECTNPDSCDGAGNCAANNEPPGAPCGVPTVTDCDGADTCDGGGSCADNLEPLGTPCGDGSDTECTDPDTCDDNGTCLDNHALNGSPCDDGLFCNQGESCLAGMCAGGSPLDCDDDIPCTTDSCNELTLQCDNPLDLGNCLIAGTCYTEGTLNPANDCEACNSAMNPMDWSFRPVDSLCDDGDPCTGTGRPEIGVDVCNGAGLCAGLPDPQCNDTCDFAIPAFEGINLSNNDNRGPDDAEASCQLDSDNDIWFAYTASCTGIVFMSTTGSQMTPSNDPVLSVWDNCPLEAGMEIACDDDSGLDLHAALMLNVVGGTTYLIRVAGFEDNTGDVVLNISTVDDCLIDGVCYEAGSLNPDTACEACTPEVSTTAWTPRAEGSSCGDPAESECDDADACDGNGVCESNHKPDGTLCTDDENECTFDFCSIGQCTHPPQPANTPCGDPADRECDGPDICDGASVCSPNNKDLGTPCGDMSATECDLADICDGAGFCSDNLAADGTTCDDTDVCTGDDQCATGLCVGTSILVAPQVSPEGSRYIEVSPQPPGSPAPIALQLTSPDWPCVFKYIAPSGSLVDMPFFQLPDDWGTLLVSGVAIAPDSQYDVVAECGTFLSAAGSATTAKYGDIVGPFVAGEWTPPDGIIDVLDFTAIVEAFQNKPTAPDLTRADIYPCTPDGIIDVLDMVWIVNSFQGDPFPCPLPCP